MADGSLLDPFYFRLVGVESGVALPVSPAASASFPVEAADVAGIPVNVVSAATGTVEGTVAVSGFAAGSVDGAHLVAYTEGVIVLLLVMVCLQAAALVRGVAGR